MTVGLGAGGIHRRMTQTTNEETASGGYQDPLERLQVYRLALEATRVARTDALAMGGDPMLRELGGQLLRAAGSIAANVAEGYSRGTTAERRKFLEYALGSARECVVWYESVAHEERRDRIERLTSIRRLLLTMIRTARESTARDRANFQR
jgi:four helix bundle protein